MKSKKIVAIIPARGGSKGIPRKNIKLLVNKPLIHYVIEAALNSKYLDDVIVSTEDKEIMEIAKLCGVKVIERPIELGGDKVTLDPVIFHALNEIEKKEKIKYDFVMTLQPTSPLLTTENIDKAIKLIKNGKYDTLISVIPEKHLFWKKESNKYIPLYKKRKNRQDLNPIYRESGAILVSKRKAISENNRIGKNITLLELEFPDNLDIDNYVDWRIAEYVLNRRTIVLIVDGDRQTGLGHIYRCLALANRLLNHNIFFFINCKKSIGIKKIKEYSYPLITFKGKKDLFRILKKIKPDIVINDILDTNSAYISKLKRNGYFVVNFEDLGTGSKKADIVINSLYENNCSQKNHYFGYKYECLREEFYIWPSKKIRKGVKKILITFGGTDPNNLTFKTLQAVEKLNQKNISIEVILGLGFEFENKLFNYINFLKQKGFVIEVKKNIRTMAKEIYDADIIVTSNGRTIYEIVTIGTPCISISQNKRESKHLFSKNSIGIENIGLAKNVSQDDIMFAIKKISEDYHLRKEMNENLLKYNLKDGIERVLKLIFDKYYERKN